MRRLGGRTRCACLISALAIALGGCGGGSGDAAAPVAQIDADAPPLHSFDIYAVGSTDDDVLSADVYGITLNPLRAYRLTANKRISWVTANATTIAAAAGDEQIDKLGFIGEGGEITAVPGLGRPHGFSPEFQPDGTMRYEDLGNGEAIVHRYMSYDPKTRKTRVLFKTKDDTASIAGAGPGDGFMSVVQQTDRDDQILFMDFKGRSRAITVAPSIGSPVAGKGFVVSAIYGATDPEAPPTDTALINPRTGKVRVVGGWAPLGVSPNRTEVLVVRPSSAAPTGSEFAILDPARVGDPRILGTISGLTFYMATWVDRSGSAG